MKRKLFKIILFIFTVTAIPTAIALKPEQMNTALTDGNGSLSFLDFLECIKSELSAASLLNAVIVIAAYLYLYKKIFKAEEPVDPHIALLSFFFSLFLLIGDSFSNFNDFRFITGSSAQFGIALLVLTGKWILFYFLLHDLYKKTGPAKEKITEEMKEEELFSTTFRYGLSLLICWFLLSQPFFPGSLPHDGRVQLNMYFGVDPMTLDHPYVSTLFLGTIYKLGAFFGGRGRHRTYCHRTIPFRSICLQLDL